VTIILPHPNCWDLMLKGINASGTTKTNTKEWPRALTLAKENMGRGNILWRMHASNLLSTITWYDNKSINVLGGSTGEKRRNYVR
jgi:hypothetical protein